VDADGGRAAVTVDGNGALVAAGIAGVGGYDELIVDLAQPKPGSGAGCPRVKLPTACIGYPYVMFRGLAVLRQPSQVDDGGRQRKFRRGKFRQRVLRRFCCVRYDRSC
jgi:hypothetical protein